MKAIRMLIIYFSLLLISGSSLVAQMNKTMNYQGLLLDESGIEVLDNNYQITFRLYANESGGSPLWTEDQSLDIESGIINAVLGSLKPLDISFDQELWLGIGVQAETELTPRIPFTGSPYSFMALDLVDGAAVKKINGATDNIEILAGENVTISQNGNQIIISAAEQNGGSGISTVITSGGLSGGGTSGEISLSIADGGVTAEKVKSGELVKSINGMKDNVQIVGGDNVQVSKNNNSLVISTQGDGR